MRAAEIYEGYKHGRWTVLSGDFRRETKTGTAWFSARCDCGTEREIKFKGGFISRSCGCLQRDVASSRAIHGQSRSRGGNKSRLYNIWVGIKQRCLNPKDTGYHNYGGRGIAVSDAWANDFLVFQEWALANGYADSLDLDREDNDGPYSPENCRWVTRTQNLRNTRTNRLVEAFGEIKTMTDWSEDPRCQVDYSVLEGRLRLNWKPEDAISLPKGRWNPERRSR